MGLSMINNKKRSAVFPIYKTMIKMIAIRLFFTFQMIKTKDKFAYKGYFCLFGMNFAGKKTMERPFFLFLSEMHCQYEQ